MSRLSIRARLTLWYSFVLFAALAVAGVVVISLQSRLGLQRIDAELVDAASTVKGVLRNEIDERLALPEAADDMLNELKLPGIGVAVLTTDGAVLASTNDRAPHLPEAAITSATTTPTYAGNAAEQFRRLSSGDAHGPDRYTIVVWTSMQQLALERATLQQAIWLGVPIAIALASFFGSMIAKRSLRPLDDALNMQRAFMADASHQLRTPVSVVRTAAQVTLSRSDRTADEYRESLEIISRQSQRLSKMVDDMFMLAMVDAHGRPLQRAPLYLDEVIGDVVRDAQPLAVERAVTLTNTPVDEVPFTGDEHLLRQMIWNLVENAVRHASAGGRIELSLSRNVDHLEIVVADDGPGIAAADRSRVFDRFVRLETASGGAGAGLGLPIARWVAEAHDGSLVLDDAARGCRFRITLPLAASS